MKLLTYIILAGFGMGLVSCVDDYQDANPPRLLDAPAVSTVEPSSGFVAEGQTVDILINVVDAPAGIDSVGIQDFDSDEEELDGTFTLQPGWEGLEKGVITATYMPPAGFSGDIEFVVEVFDGQVDEDGEDARKSSGTFETEVTAVCGAVSGEYDVSGEIIVDDFGSGPYAYEDVIGLEDCATEGAYVISDISGGLYTNDYATAYGTDPAEAVIEFDPTTSGPVTWSGVDDQFGGQIIEDPAGMGSNYDASTGVITIYWTATEFGERGITTYTAK